MWLMTCLPHLIAWPINIMMQLVLHNLILSQVSIKFIGCNNVLIPFILQPIATFYETLINITYVSILSHIGIRRHSNLGGILA